MSNKKSMTTKQKTFCDEYLIDLNATQAAIRAGYSKKTAKEIGCENLSKPNIAEYLAEKKAERTDRTNITLDYVLKGIKDIAELGEQENNRLKALDLLGKHVGAYEMDNTQSKPDAVTTITKVYVNE